MLAEPELVAGPGIDLCMVILEGPATRELLVSTKVSLSEFPGSRICLLALRRVRTFNFLSDSLWGSSSRVEQLRVSSSTLIYRRDAFATLR